MSSPIDWVLILQSHKTFISEWFQGGDHQHLKNHYQQHISSINICNIFFKNLKWIQVLPNLKPGPDAWKMLMIFFPHDWLCFMHTLQRFRFSGNICGGSIWWQPKSQVKRELWMTFLFHSWVCSNLDDSGVWFCGNQICSNNQKHPAFLKLSQLLWRRK